MIRLFLFLFRCTVIFLLVLATLWAAGAIWFRVPYSEAIRFVGIAVAGFLGAGSIVSIAGHARFRFHYVFAVAFAALLVWWSTIDPPLQGDWAPDVARQTTGEIQGDLLMLSDVRAFEWVTETEADEIWVTREYDLSRLATMDLFLSYWAGPQMAHFILSFGFEDGKHVAWTVEVKRTLEGAYSPVADFFKTNTLAIIAAEEYDVVGLRTNKRGEDVRLYRLNTSPERARQLLEEYVTEANQLAQEAKWYNSIFTNCTTVVFKMLSTLGIDVGFDWRIIANGYLPGFLYERGALNNTFALEALEQAGQITPKGRAVELDPGFSAAIRDGVPTGITAQ